MIAQSIHSAIGNVSIRTVEERDLPALEWSGEYIHFRHLYQNMYKNSIIGDSILWIAELDGTGVIGQIFVQLISARLELADGCNKAYLFAFRVRENFRNNGIGSLLLFQAEKDLIMRGFTWSVLNVSQQNMRVRRYYERVGYQVVGLEAGRWSYIDHLGRLHEVNDPSWRLEKNIKAEENVKKYEEVVK